MGLLLKILVSSLILANVLQAEGGTGTTRHVYMTCGSGVPISWQLDVDYYLTAWALMSAGGTNWALTLDGRSPGTAPGNVNEANKVFVDTVLASALTGTSGSQQSMTGLRTLLRKDQRIYFFNGTAFEQSINLVLQRVL